MSAITFPISIISGTVNLSPRTMLQSVQAVCTLPFMWGKALSIRSRPRLTEVVPQYTQGLTIYSSISAALRSHSSTRWYAFLRKVALPFCVWPHRLMRALRNSFCSELSADQRSFRRSRPFLRALWHGLHSYDKPSGRDFSLWKFSGVASRFLLHRKQVRYIMSALYMARTKGQGEVI